MDSDHHEKLDMTRGHSREQRTPNNTLNSFTPGPPTPTDEDSSSLRHFSYDEHEIARSRADESATRKFSGFDPTHIPDDGDLSTHQSSPRISRHGSIKSRTSNSSHRSFASKNQDTVSLKSRTSIRSRSPEPTVNGIDTTSSRSISLHRRSPSNHSVHSMISYTSTDKVSQEPSVPTLYVNPPRKGLTCMICALVFDDPVLGSCGHTFCRKCIIQSLSSGGACPSSQHRGVQLSKTNLTSNIMIVEELAELEIYCKYGLIPVAGGGCVLNQEGCQEILTQGTRQAHESMCPHRLESCPNSYACGQIKSKHMPEHLKTCQNFSCSHKTRGCKFVGTQERLLLHLQACKYELVKGFLQESDARIQSLSETLEVKDQEIEFLKAMLAKLSEKVESMERNFDERIGNLGGLVEQLNVDVHENVREISDMRDEFGNLQEQLDVEDQRVLKCAGTFVGHQGPVWALAAHENLLFSGSSDETVKVWDTQSKQSFTNVKTLKGHRGIVHALTTYKNILYSGSHDCTINVWDIQTYELLDTLIGHDNPVCTLAIANDILFSGSLKVVNIWDLRTNTLVGSLSGFNHWVRALVATNEFLFAGSYQIVSIWSSLPDDILPILKEGKEPKCLEQLKTSGGSIYSLMLTDKFIIAGTYEHLIHVWDGKTLDLVNTLEGHAGTVYALDSMVRANGAPRLFSASYDRTIRVWDLETFACLQVLARHENSVDALAVQKKWVFSGAADSNIKVWQY
eukprot:m.76227 g.76227  ORF g.76227 m.76227 type:complete len:739 (-) comp24877_c0_seq1:162-2378(-)